jgi:hypothetical protein
MKLYSQIMQHLDLLNALTRSTKLLLLSSQKRDINLIEQVTENRDRLINVIKTIQVSIENQINEINPRAYKPEHIDVFKSWSKEVNQIIQFNDQMDQECLALLEGQKEETTKEIATVYKNHQSIKGYDLSSVKK